MRFLMTAVLMMGFAMPAVAQKPYEGSLRVRVFDAPSDEIDLFVYANSPAAQKYFSCLLPDYRYDNTHLVKKLFFYSWPYYTRGPT